MTDGSTEQTREFLGARVAALETLITELLPMLIEGSHHEADVRQTLEEWETEPPPLMQGNEAFARAVQELIDFLPNP